jgi:CheY-like chemotaxis protein
MDSLGRVSSPNILIVDDEEKNLQALEAMIANLGEINIVRAKSGRECLKKVLEQNFVVILLDVNMPEMDGFEAAKAIRARGSSKNIPIVFVTAYADGEMDIDRGYALGAIDYIIKPIKEEILMAKVRVFVELFWNKTQLEEALFAQQAENDRLKNLSEGFAKEQTQRQGFQAFGRQNSLDDGQLTILCAKYKEVVFRTVKSIALKEERPSDHIQGLALMFAEIDSSAKDVTQVHLQVSKDFLSTAIPSEGRVFANGARLALIELMGELVNVYRNEQRKGSIHAKTR